MKFQILLAIICAPCIIIQATFASPECYICYSNNETSTVSEHQACMGGGTENIPIVLCPEDFCLTIVGILDGAEVIIRGCVTNEISAEECQAAGNDSGFSSIDCHACAVDRCNGESWLIEE